MHLAKELLSDIPQDESTLIQWDDLRVSFIQFLHTVKCAITTNERLIKPERRDYHKAGFKFFTLSLNLTINLIKHTHWKRKKSNEKQTQNFEP